MVSNSCPEIDNLFPDAFDFLPFQQAAHTVVQQ